MSGYPVEYRDSPVHGRGVFATRDIKRGEVIEVCPAVMVESRDITKRSFLWRYMWPLLNDRGFSLIVLGYGSLYNHEENPNARKVWGKGWNDSVFKARRAIAKGDEITVNYSGGAKLTVEQRLGWSTTFTGYAKREDQRMERYRKAWDADKQQRKEDSS